MKDNRNRRLREQRGERRINNDFTVDETNVSNDLRAISSSSCIIKPNEKVNSSRFSNENQGREGGGQIYSLHAVISKRSFDI